MTAIKDVAQALTAAAIAGVDFDAQDDYCEACRAYHVDATHEDDVLVECGAIRIWTGSAVADCNRSPHQDDEHRTVTGIAWDESITGGES